MKKLVYLKVILIVVLLYFGAGLAKAVPPTIDCKTPSAVQTSRVSGGLITAQDDIDSKFSSNSAGVCAIDPNSAFVSYKIPTYADLKSIYFDQAKDNYILEINKNNPIPSTDATQNNIPMGVTENQLYYIDGNLNVSSAPSGSKTGIVFVNGNLNFTNNYIYGSDTAGTVFIVSGDVNIASTVTRIEAVIIAGGTIYTADNPCNPNPISQLIINGSLISLTEGQPIQFCRTLIDNSQAAEKINYQPKYLVILKDIFSGSLQKWSEIQ